MLYLINKKSGISSFWVIKKARKILNERKIWHTWTLDPLATGLLLVASWESTKLIPYLEKRDKTYVFSFNMDWFSESWDLEKPIQFLNRELLEKKKKELEEKHIIQLIEKDFMWEISQIPTKYSAIKIDWKKAYELARAWHVFEMKARKINISSYKLLEFDFPKITLEMTVSSWTYIRTIAEDIWKALWLNAYVTYLHRSWIWELNEQEAVDIEEILVKWEISYEKALNDFSSLCLDDYKITQILNWTLLEAPSWDRENTRYILSDKNWKYISLLESAWWSLKILANRIS